MSPLLGAKKALATVVSGELKATEKPPGHVAMLRRMSIRWYTARGAEKRNEFNEHWRREWDSNPRYGFPHTRFPSVRLKPLGHLSGAPSLEGAPLILQGTVSRSTEKSLRCCV